MNTDTINALATSVREELSMGSSDAMHTWDTERRKLFDQTLRKRASANNAVLKASAMRVLMAARHRRFISETQFQRAHAEISSAAIESLEVAAQVSGRTPEELMKVADERAKDIINQMPTLKEALRVMAPHLVKPLAEKDGLSEELHTLDKTYVEQSKQIVMSEVDQSMTLGQFRQLIVDREKAREKTHARMKTLADKLTTLERQIAEVLVKGVPELADEILKTAHAQVERALELGQMSRRIGESVMFGDSESAQKILAEYESDELKTSAEFKTMFSKALERLQLKGPKATTKKKKEVLLNG